MLRTDRNNNPTAMTTDVARSLGLIEGKDYVQGDKFPGSSKLYTAKLLGNPIDTTIKGIDQGGFYTQSGKPRWTYTGEIPGVQNWDGLSHDQKTNVVLAMYKREGGNGSLANGANSSGVTEATMTTGTNLTLNEQDKKELAGVIQEMESKNYSPDKIKKVVRGYIADHQSNGSSDSGVYNLPTTAPAETAAPENNDINIPGLTVESKGGSNEGKPVFSKGYKGGTLAPDFLTPDQDDINNQNNYKNVKNPIARATRQTIHTLGQNTVGVGKSLLSTGLDALPVIAGAFNKDAGTAIKGIESKLPERLTHGTNNEQKAGKIGGNIGQLLAGAKAASDATGVTEKFNGAKTVAGKVLGTVGKVAKSPVVTIPLGAILGGGKGLLHGLIDSIF